MVLFVCLYLKFGKVMYIQCKAKLPFKSCFVTDTREEEQPYHMMSSKRTVP